MRILIIEDDAELCEAIAYHLKREGYTADVCHSGGDALHFIKQQAYQLILLDRMLPEQNGISVLQQMRARGIQTPVIITTALNGVGDRIEGLDAGADDYLIKPFAMDELLARIRAVSRRPSGLDIERILRFYDLSLNLITLTLKGPTASHTLSRREAELMEIFLENPRRLLPRSLLLSRVWGPDAPVEDGNLDNYIHFLRRRLKTVGSHARIKTARAIGYSLGSGEELPEEQER